MRHLIEDTVLTIYLEGEVNSYNSEEVEKEIDGIVAKGGFKVVKLDLTDLRYISSAGLRIIVRLKQQYEDTSLINVPSGVYDVFEMVGFTNMFTIEKL